MISARAAPLALTVFCSALVIPNGYCGVLYCSVIDDCYLVVETASFQFSIAPISLTMQYACDLAVIQSLRREIFG